jgi:hypothetical protein
VYQLHLHAWIRAYHQPLVPPKEHICILQPRMGGFEKPGETILLLTDITGGGSTIIESTFLPIVQWLHRQLVFMTVDDSEEDMMKKLEELIKHTLLPCYLMDTAKSANIDMSLYSNCTPHRRIRLAL